MEIKFVITPTDGGWEAVCREYVVIITARTIDDLLYKIRKWVENRFPGENVKIVLVSGDGAPRSELYVPGPATPIHIDPDMFRI